MMKRLTHALEGLAAHAAFRLFRALPVDAASALGGAVARRIGPRLTVSNRARRNLAAAFPGKGAAEIEAIVRAMWDNLGRTIGEFAHLDAFHPYADGGRIEVEGAEHVDALRDDGRPGLIFAGHLANWEVQIFALTRRGLPEAAVTYRAANNPHVERLYRRARGGPFGGRWLAKGPRGARRVVETLRRGGHVAMLVDQKMNDGLPVRFFGRDAMTAPGLAQLALRFDCPIVPCRIRRLTGARFRVTFLPPLEIRRSNDRVADARAIMTRVNGLIEDWIRDDPAQWLWLHRRWPRS